MAIDLQSVTIDEIRNAWLSQQRIQLRMLRLDKIHPVISGNKWFKLKENLRAAKQCHKNTLLTFGGAYSNHLIATAAAARESGFYSIGFIRGFHGNPQTNPTLKACLEYGMELKFLSREAYNQKDEEYFIAQLKQQYPKAWIIPEGGNNSQGRKGVEEIVRYQPNDAELIVLPVGSGATFAGLRNVTPSSKKMMGFVPFKNADNLKVEIQSHLLPSVGNWELCTDNQFGGFAKQTPELLRFLNAFYRDYQIPLDFIYTGKMMFGLFELIQQHHFPKHTSILAIHTGGLQGNASLALDYTVSKPE